MPIRIDQAIDYDIGRRAYDHTLASGEHLLLNRAKYHAARAQHGAESQAAADAANAAGDHALWSTPVDAGADAANANATTARAGALSDMSGFRSAGTEAARSALLQSGYGDEAQTFEHNQLQNRNADLNNQDQETQNAANRIALAQKRAAAASNMIQAVRRVTGATPEETTAARRQMAQRFAPQLQQMGISADQLQNFSYSDQELDHVIEQLQASQDFQSVEKIGGVLVGVHRDGSWTVLGGNNPAQQTAPSAPAPAAGAQPAGGAPMPAVQTQPAPMPAPAPSNATVYRLPVDPAAEQEAADKHLETVARAEYYHANAGKSDRWTPRGAGGGGGSGGAGGSGLSDSAIDHIARQAYQFGAPIPSSLGRSGRAQAAIQNRIATLAEEAGDDSGAQTARSAANAANRRALSSVGNRRRLMDAAERATERELNFVQEALHDVRISNSPFFNVPINRWNSQAQGDPHLAAFRTYVHSAANEYARVISGSTGSAGITEGGREQAAQMINENMSPSQILSTITAMRRGMAAKNEELAAEERDIQSDMSGGDQGGAPAPAPPPAPGDTTPAPFVPQGGVRTTPGVPIQHNGLSTSDLVRRLNGR